VPPNYNTPSNYTNNYPSTVANYPAPSNYGNPTSPQPNANYPNTGAYTNAQGNYPAVQPSYSSPNLGTPSYAGPYPTNYGYSQPNLHTGVGTSPNYPRGSNSPLSRAASSPVTPVSAARDAVPASSTSGAQEQPLIIVYKKGILKGVDTRNLEITDQALLEVPSEVLQISGLSVFKFSRNRLTAVPKRLCGLGKLTILDLSRNQIKKIPSQIALLNHLRILMLNDNEISEVPLAITSCTALEELHLQGNKIESVPLNLVALDRLVLLDLGLNSLNALSNDLQHWSLLRTLRINDNKFTELPNGIDKLPNLEVLEVQGNPLTQLPANIGELSRLEVLKAGNCQLSSVPASVSRLTSLTALHLNNNKFTELPNEIYQLTALRELCLQSNEVSDVPPHVIKLSQLSYLDLSNNKLQSLPYQIGQMRIATGHTSLRLEGNPFTELIPREIMLQGTPAIISFLRMLNTSKSSWRRVKLVLVGQEEVGKTSLRKALVETSGTSSAFGGTLRRKKSTQVGAAAIQASGDTVATDGIDIEDWTLTGVTGEGATAADPVTGATVSDLTFSCWDFGGQEV
jgi:Leucine-rich repeat (LRR) protein